MLRKSKVGASLLLLVACCARAAEPVAVDIANDRRGHDVPETLWGGFLEEINYAVTGGLYPELIANRGFDWGTVGVDGWELDSRGGGMARLTKQNGRPVHEATATHLRIESFGAGAGVGVKNCGYHGIWLEEGKRYDLTFYARGLDGYAGGFRAVIESADADRTPLFEYAVANRDMVIGPKAETAVFPLPDWKRYETVVTAKKTGFVTFSLLLDATGAVEFEQVSLFPQDTWGGRKNGLRKDLVQLMKDYKMAFIRYPGGCYCEGQDWPDWFDWKLSVGDGTLESRRCIWNLWGYWNEMGLGYYEYLLLCEDIGALPLPVVNVGMTCQYRKPKVAPPDSKYFADAACDLVEFTIGDAKTTKWGALRAKMGHPAPFKLRFIELSNEQWGPEYIARAKVVSAALRTRYPQLQIIGDAYEGGGGHGPWRSYAWKNFTRADVDILDEHFYEDAAWFRANSRRYDAYPRRDDLPKVYAGEYACRDWGQAKEMIKLGLCSKAKTNCSTPRNALHGALSEAMTLAGFERNSDIVRMTSYSPMFCKEDRSFWTPGFIWIRNEGSYASTSYYAHKMFSCNRPTYHVPSEATLDGREVIAAQQSGEVGDGTFEQVCGFDVATNELVVKLVNVSATPRAVTLRFAKPLTAGEAKRQVLTGDRLALNTFREPKKCVPVETKFAFGGGASFSVELPAYSLSVYRFP